MTSRKGGVTFSEQTRRFVEKARELGCDEDPEAFERVFARVVPPKRPPEPQSQRAKGTATKRRLTKTKK
jgi:hypothetical protein